MALLLLVIEVTLLAIIVSTVATKGNQTILKWIILAILYSHLINLDSRPCDEKILGPVHNDNSTPTFHFHVADENNIVVLRCRVICQEHGAWYTPHVRIITTKDGQIYHRRSANLFEVEYSPSDVTCDSASPTQDYEFRITALNNTFNESIATCGLFYQSNAERSFSQYCHTSSVAWITLHNQPPPVSPTTPIPPISPPSKGPTPDIGGTGYSVQFCTPRIPEEVSITFIALTFFCIVVIGSLVFGGVLFACKKLGKTRKRKVSIQPSDDGSGARHSHGGVYAFEDVENDDSNLTLRVPGRC